MSHYFQDDPNLASNIKTISFEVNGLTMNLLTDNGVFSKNRVDEGSLAFLRVFVGIGVHGVVNGSVRPSSRAPLFRQTRLRIAVGDFGDYADRLVRRRRRDVRVSNRDVS